MDNLDITPAFIDTFRRINKHLDLLPFQKLLNDQNSTLDNGEKLDLKNKINESAKKVRQLNLVLDELKDQILGEIEKVQHDFEERNRDLDALEAHLNYVRTNRFNQNQAINKTAVLRERTQEMHNELNNQVKNDSFNQVNNNELTEDILIKKDQLTANQFESNHKFSNLPKKSCLKIPNLASSNLRQPKQNSGSQLNSVLKSSQLKKPLLVDEFKYNSINKLSLNKNAFKNEIKNDKQAGKKEKTKNVDNIYINYPQINYISLSEFNYIPKYMRGRLSFETCNRLVDEFNKTIEIKYKFMMTPTGKYSNEELIKYTLYKNQEDEETKGLFFVSPKDLHDYSDLKISMNNTKIFIQCVRHCKRIKEIRGIDKLIRYVVLNW